MIYSRRPRGVDRHQARSHSQRLQKTLKHCEYIWKNNAKKYVDTYVNLDTRIVTKNHTLKITLENFASYISSESDKKNQEFQKVPRAHKS